MKGDQTSQPLCKISYEHPYAREQLTSVFVRHLFPFTHTHQFVCLAIGSDRSTGDALGPLVGSFLQHLSPKGMAVYGTLEAPVHAVNLEETIKHIGLSHPLPYTIAVDACLGQSSHVGLLTVKEGGLKPGAGVNKNLPEVGQLSFTCVVNVGGFMEHFVLQNTRLGIIVKMAEIMAQSLHAAITHVYGLKEVNGTNRH